MLPDRNRELALVIARDPWLTFLVKELDTRKRLNMTTQLGELGRDFLKHHQEHLDRMEAAGFIKTEKVNGEYIIMPASGFDALFKLVVTADRIGGFTVYRH